MSDADFKVLFKNSSGLYLILRPDFTIFSMTEAYAQATMTRIEEIEGKNIFEVFPDNPVDPIATGTRNLKASLERVITNGQADHMPIQKYDIRRPIEKGGGFEERFWNPTNYPILDQNQQLKFILHRVEDVTEFVRFKRHKLQEHGMVLEMRSNPMDQQVQQAQKLEAMGQLAGGVAHDFNNIVSTILLHCESLFNDPKISTATRKGLEQIHGASTRAAALTRQLLAFSRKQILQPKPTNINYVIQETSSMLRRIVTESVQLEMELDETLGNTLIDEGQFEQILFHLLVNAREAMPEGGRLHIRTSQSAFEQPISDGQNSIPAGEYITVEIKDTGIGMSAQTQARLFEPFFTTKAIGKGSGLGLATVYGIVSQNKGMIQVYSEQGQGSSFRILLPRAQTTVASPVKNPTVSTLKNSCILVVEDQQDLREIVCDTLRSKGYDIHEAENGIKAWNIISSRNKPFDLVITDVVMPEMGGPVLAKKVLSVAPKTKILFLSGYSKDSLNEHGIEGAQPYFLEKPFAVSALLNEVKRILALEIKKG